MARYIDAELLMQKLSRMIDYCEKNKDKKFNALNVLFQVGDAIMDCPTADVVPKSEYDAVVSAVDNSTKEFLKLHDDYQEAKRTVKRWIFENSPFEMLDIAFNRLFPNVKYTAFFEPNIRDNEHGEKVCGFTDFDDEGKITIFIDTDLSINDAVEIFAHELAHAGVGVEQEHNERWQKAFDDLFDEYNKIGDEMFGSSIEAPKGESYSKALSEIEQIKQEFAREILDKLDRFINSNCIEIKDERGRKGYVTSGVHFAIAEFKNRYIPQNDDRCVVCGEIIPEGRQVCPRCEKGE